MAVVQWVRRWSSNHSVVQGEGSGPRGMFTESCFSNDFYFSLMLGLMDFSDTAILCSRPNNCCKHNPKCFDKPLYFIVLEFVFMKEQ